MSVLEVKDVKKSFGKRSIIKGLTFEVREGEIFGFLGPNGAGKTTTIRMMVGLISPDSGSIKIMGHDIKDRKNALKNVGAIVENPDMYGDLSGRENLRVFGRMYGNNSKEKLEEVIEEIGLKDRIDDKVKKYSLGMRQRLGIGQALMGDPKILILDEPINGLDPMGIVEFRNIVKKLAVERNCAVFISSHILAEIEQTCDIVAFIDHGVIKSVEHMKDVDSNNKQEAAEIVCKDIDKCCELLSKIPSVKNMTKGEGTVSVMIDRDCMPDVIHELVSNDIMLEEFYKKHQGLEERFMEIVKEGGDK